MKRIDTQEKCRPARRESTLGHLGEADLACVQGGGWRFQQTYEEPEPPPGTLVPGS